MRLARTLIIPVATYGAETWTLSKRETAYASATIMTAIRRAASQQGSMGRDKKWKPGASNKTLRSQASIPRPETMLRMMRLRHLGATIRCEGAPLLKDTLRARTPAPKTRGTPSMTWHQQTERDLHIAQLQRADAHNMRTWKKRIRELGDTTKEEQTEDSEADDEEINSDGHTDEDTDEDIAKS